jgi:AcrR family transcriptional regulator
MASKDRSAATRDAILEAAIEEFIDHGFAGVRIEHVAKRAGYNKALVYRWFKDRETLFREALKRRFSQRAGLLDKLPQTLPEILRWWSQQTASDPNFMRMILREALEIRDKEPVHAEFRREYYRRQVEILKSFQMKSRVGPEFDLEMLFIALLSVVTLTSALPQIVQLATGLHPEDKKFQKRWADFLDIFAAYLSGSTRSAGCASTKRTS